MQQRQYQQAAINFLVSSKRGIVKAPAGAGKTHIAASALAVCLSKRSGIANVEVMVNTREQVDQMLVACGRFPVIAAKCNLHVYCAAGAPVNTQPHLLIVDECHRAAAPGWRTKIEQCATARWGLSATPFSGDAERDTVVQQLFANNLHAIERTELVHDGHLAAAKVTWHDVQANEAQGAILSNTEALVAARRKKMPYLFSNEPSANKQINQCKWQAAQQHGIWNNSKRDNLITALACSALADGRHVIVLIGSIDHGRNLLTGIPGAELVYSKMGAKRRADAIARFKSGALRCMVGTSAIEEGFDAPIADTIIMAGCGRSERKAIQATGRVLRPYDGKQCGHIHDFSDGFNPMLKRQSAQRRRIYGQLKYKQIVY